MFSGSYHLTRAVNSLGLWETFLVFLGFESFLGALRFYKFLKFF